MGYFALLGLEMYNRQEIMYKSQLPATLASIKPYLFDYLLVNMFRCMTNKA